MSDTQEPKGELHAGTPRWVKAFGVTFLVLALLVIVIMVVSGGNHGPGRHIPSMEPREQRP